MASVAIGIQCRVSSSRLPAKALLSFLDTTLLGFCIMRAQFTNLPIYVLTSSHPSDDLIANEALKYPSCDIIRGDLDDVMSRYCSLGEIHGYDYLVRVTADNPLTEFRFIDDLLQLILDNGSDYVSVNPDCCPKGTSLEIVKTSSLSKIHSADPSQFAREHVTTEYLQTLNSRDLLIPDPSKYFDSSSSRLSFTIDTLNEYVFVHSLVQSLVSEAPSSFLDFDFITKCTYHALLSMPSAIILNHMNISQ